MPDAYLEHGLKVDRAELEHVRALIDETAATLVRTCAGDRWPYVVGDGERPDPRVEMSASTNSMNAFALAAASGIALASPLAPDPPTPNLLGTKTAAALEDTPGDLTELLARAMSAVVDDADRRGLVSRTYGQDDPFTLGWLVPLLAALEIRWPKRTRILRKRLTRAWDSNDRHERDLFKPENGDALSHAFPLLRVVHLTQSAAELMPRTAPRLPPELADEFATTVHRQLSNSKIADASFDPAELIFAFEGLLRSPGGEPSGALVDRFFDVVAEAHEPSWRPLRPFIRTETGLVLLPLSIEGATSLARICRELDRRGDRDRRFGQLIERFRTFVQWLESQRVRITVDGQALSGWHSEHVREPKTIYTWQTSQVLLFLLLYAELLEIHVAERALTASNLSIKRNPEQGPEPGDSASWKLVWGTFLRQTKRGGPIKQTDNRSAVLYGPPGTGKTTLAEWLAAALGWPLITVTPSDFMAQGTAAVEARAQAVFTALQQQLGAVVIFDEIDRLILDRDRREYHTSEGAFQLMTPSMLTKFNDLRKGEGVIFLAATNYRERIDRAIIRPGRFDQQLLIAPPDARERTKFLEARWMKKLRTDELSPDEARTLATLGRRTPLATYGDLKNLVQAASNLEGLQDAVGKFAPTISLESYDPRMEEDRPPYDEVLALAKLQPARSRSAKAKSVVAQAEASGAG